MAAIVTRNQLVRETKTAGGLRLTAPLRSHPLKSLAPAKEKSFDLDDLGAFVWHAIDNRRSVEDLIRHFAKQKTVNLREAEVAVTAFLSTLAKRNLIALAVP